MVRRLALILSSVLVLCAGIAASARAETIVPVEGNWNATTSAGLPISFQVGAGQVANAYYRFKWGFCGSFYSHLDATVAIDPATNHWLYPDPRGTSIEATFVAPDKAEGVVIAPDRMTPGCPRTEATFVAAPGPPLPPPPEPRRVYLAINVERDYRSIRPYFVELTREGFYAISVRWRNWGGKVAVGTGVALTERGCEECPGFVREWPRVKLRLTDLAKEGDHEIYGHLSYVLIGERAPGFARRGSLNVLPSP